MYLLKKTEEERKALHIAVDSGSYLDKCLKALKEAKGGRIMIDDYDTHHLLTLNGKGLDGHMICTTKQANRLIPFADEKVLILTRGWEYHFYNYR